MTVPWSNQRVDLVIINATVSGFSGLFVYSPTVGTGHLVGSIAAAAGTDPFGNAYLPGIFSYFPSATALNYATGLINNQAEFATAPAGSNGAGPWTSRGTINLDATGSILTLSGLTGVASVSPLAADNGLTVTNGETVDTLTVTAGETANTIAITNSTGAGGLLTITNNTATGTANILELLTAITDRAYGVRLSTDTNLRMSWTAAGVFNWGSGAAAADTSLYRGGAAQLAAAYTAYDNAGTPEVWQAPVFANSWANSGAGPALQFRRVAAPYKSVQWVGQVTVPVGFVAGQAVITALGLAFRPVNNQSVLGVDLTTGGLVRFQYGSGGILKYESGAGAAGDAIDIIAGNLISLDA